MYTIYVESLKGTWVQAFYEINERIALAMIAHLNAHAAADGYRVNIFYGGIPHVA